MLSWRVIYWTVTVYLSSRHVRYLYLLEIHQFNSFNSIGWMPGKVWKKSIWRTAQIAPYFLMILPFQRTAIERNWLIVISATQSNILSIISGCFPARKTAKKLLKCLLSRKPLSSLIFDSEHFLNCDAIYTLTSFHYVIDTYVRKYAQITLSLTSVRVASGCLSHSLATGKLSTAEAKKTHTFHPCNLAS